MTSIPFFQVDAFADRPLTGNPAAVLPLERWLDDGVMQAIAAENNLSETAFTIPSENDGVDYELRWFTPTTEVPLCGHATLATGHALMSGNKFAFRPASGHPDRQPRGRPFGPRCAGPPGRTGEDPALLDALGVRGELFVGHRAESAAIVLLDNEDAVRAVTPDFQALKAFHDLVIVTAPGDEQEVASRVFAVPCGIDEDPVTGAAHAALVPFWANRLGRNHFTALQASKRAGLLDCRLEGDRVLLGGHCHTVIVGQFQL